MPDTLFLKDNLSGSVPTEISENVIKNIVNYSVAFNVCRHVSMESDKKVLPMLSDTGKAYWVDEGEPIGTSLHGWEYPMLEAKKLAVIIPCTKEKISDSVMNVMKEIKEGIADAFVRAIDSAVFFGNNTPFDTNIFDTCTNSVNLEDSKSLDYTISKGMELVEANDLIPNAIIAPISAKNEFRILRDAVGNSISVIGGMSYSRIYDTQIYYPTSRSFDTSKAEFLLGDFNRAIIGTRDNITYEVLDQATVGGVNLAERDLIAIKCTMRFGFKVVDPKAFTKILPSV